MNGSMKDALDKIIQAARHDSKFDVKKAFEILNENALYDYHIARTMEDVLGE